MMQRQFVFGGAIVLAAAFLAYLLIAPGDDPGSLRLKPDDTGIATLGSEIYVRECASCHGANLEGAPNWKERDADGYLPAPPHDASGHTWHHDGELLFRITKHGLAAVLGDPSYASNMPAYEDVLSDAEIIAVLSYIKSTWPPRVRAHHDTLEDNR